LNKKLNDASGVETPLISAQCRFQGAEENFGEKLAKSRTQKPYKRRICYFIAKKGSASGAFFIKIFTRESMVTAKQTA